MGWNGKVKGSNQFIFQMSEAVALFRREAGAQVPVSQLHTFLIASGVPGMSITEVCEKAGVPSGSKTQNILSLATGNSRKGYERSGKKLLSLKKSPDDSRKKQVELTPEGEILRDKMEAIFS